MSYQYDEYIKKHRLNVSQAYDWICNNLPEIIPYDGHVNISVHDESKFSQEEYDAYDEYFYGNDLSYQVQERFNIAWLYHIHNNPHHWQYWILFEDDPVSGKPFKCLEMICDWWSFSFAKGDLYEIFNWYDDHRGTIQMHPKTKKTVEDILSKIKEKLDGGLGDGNNRV